MSDDGRVIDGEIVETLPIVADVRSGDNAYVSRSGCKDSVSTAVESMKSMDTPIEETEDAYVPGTDRASGEKRGRRGPSPSIRKGRIAADVLSGEEPFVGRAMVKHGLSPNTARSPALNGYGNDDLIEAMRVVFPSIPSPADVAAKGLKAVNELLDDPDASTDRKAQVGYTVWAKHADLGGEDPNAGRDTLGPYRRAEAVKLLDRFVHVARLVDRLGLAAVVAALVARRDEIELGAIEAAEREAVPVLRRSVAAALGEELAAPAERGSSNMARVYRRHRAGGFTVAATSKPELRRDRR